MAGCEFSKRQSELAWSHWGSQIHELIQYEIPRFSSCVSKGLDIRKMGLDMGQVFENSQNQNVITILLHVGVDSPILAGEQACSQHPNVNFVGAFRGEIVGATI